MVAARGDGDGGSVHRDLLRALTGALDEQGVEALTRSCTYETPEQMSRYGESLQAHGWSIDAQLDWVIECHRFHGLGGSVQLATDRELTLLGLLIEEGALPATARRRFERMPPARQPAREAWLFGNRHRLARLCEEEGVARGQIEAEVQIVGESRKETTMTKNPRDEREWTNKELETDTEGYRAAREARKADDAEALRQKEISDDRERFVKQFMEKSGLTERQAEEEWVLYRRQRAAEEAKQAEQQAVRGARDRLQGLV